MFRCAADRPDGSQFETPGSGPAAHEISVTSRRAATPGCTHTPGVAAARLDPTRGDSGALTWFTRNRPTRTVTRPLEPHTK